MKDNPAAFPQKVSTSPCFQVIQPGDTVCCALSGGADSVSLLYVMRTLSVSQNFHVTAVHVNHNLRGEESDRDQAFCVSLCARLQVPLQVFSVDVQARAQSEHISIELAARKCRYACFRQVDADWIATAHTATDNVETFLHRLIRGAGLHGLTSIPIQSGNILRPLLSVTRQEVEAYLESLSQPYCVDSTNETNVYTRNRIRHQIMPELRKLNPSLERTVTHTIQSLTRDDAFLEAEAEDAYRVCHTAPHRLEHLTSYHEAIQVRCIARLLTEDGLDYDGKMLEKLLQLCKTGGQWTLHPQMYAVAEKGTLCIQKVEEVAVPSPVPLHFGDNQLYPGYILRATLSESADFEHKEAKSLNVHRNFTSFTVDYDKIKGVILVSPRVTGARIRLAGRDFTSSLKKCIQAKVPRERRSTIHCLTDDAGIFYAEFIGVADRVKLDATTRRFLTIRVLEEHTYAGTDSESPNSSDAR